MSDPITIIQAIAAAGGISAVGRNLLDFLGYMRGVAGSDMVAAYFSHDGTRLHGSAKVDVERHSMTDTVWWFSCKEVDDYVFTKFPVGGTSEEIIGTVSGEKNPDSRFWRWVAPARSGTIVGGGTDPPSLKTEFVIVGYRPKALVGHFSSAAR